MAPKRGVAAAEAARAFLAGYLPYSYGRERARRVQRATAQLLRKLERFPPRVSATVARAHPWLVSVRAEATLGRQAIGVVAVVEDGQRRYELVLELRASRGRWLVSAVGG